MHIGRIIVVSVGLSLASSLHAQECSGGMDGGMDATGNQCNTPDAQVARRTEPALERPAPAGAAAVAQAPENAGKQPRPRAADARHHRVAMARVKPPH